MQVIFSVTYIMEVAYLMRIPKAVLDFIVDVFVDFLNQFQNGLFK